jgi:predicted Zn-dependent protease
MMARNMKPLVCLALILASPLLRAEQDVIGRAMHDEMQRSMQKLRLEQFDQPYFISYLVVANESKEVAATLGGVLSSTENNTRSLQVVVRVGDYASDSGNFLSAPSGSGSLAAMMMGGAIALPLDDNYNELRRRIWLATDHAYKKALEDLSGKQAILRNRNRSEKIADFSKTAPVSTTDLAPRVHFDLPEATRLVRDTSAVFRQTPSIQTSRVQLVMFNRQERYLNSEGSSFTRAQPRVSLRITASAQAPDGMPLSDFVADYGHSLQDLPAATVLLTQARELQAEIGLLQAARLQDRYEGPVLFEGQAAAEVFSRHFAGGLTAVPPLVSGGDQFAQAFRQQSSGMLDKVGLRVLPTFMDVVDDATVTHEKQSLLFGGYKVDEEGVTPRRTTLVEHGMLKTLLTSRAPVRGITASTGNMRELGVAPSNLFVTSDKTSTPEELRKRLVESAKTEGYAYGIIVRRLSGNAATVAYRIYPDGHEELIRNADVSELTAASFKSISAVSDQRTVYTEAAPTKNLSAFNFDLAGGAQPLASFVVPSMLFADVTIEKPSGESPKPTIIGSPLAEKP